jgi:hypothetical protein
MLMLGAVPRVLRTAAYIALEPIVEVLPAHLGGRLRLQVLIEHDRRPGEGLNCLCVLLVLLC